MVIHKCIIIINNNNNNNLVNEREKAPSFTGGSGWDRIRVLSIINSVNVKNNK